MALSLPKNYEYGTQLLLLISLSISLNIEFLNVSHRNERLNLLIKVPLALIVMLKIKSNVFIMPIIFNVNIFIILF